MTASVIEQNETATEERLRADLAKAVRRIESVNKLWHDVARRMDEDARHLGRINEMLSELQSDRNRIYQELKKVQHGGD